MEQSLNCCQRDCMLSVYETTVASGINRKPLFQCWFRDDLILLMAGSFGEMLSNWSETFPCRVG